VRALARCCFEEVFVENSKHLLELEPGLVVSRIDILELE
jgi:hypothetical protein